MIISYSKDFIKQSKKLDVGMRQKLVSRIELFNKNPYEDMLHNHALKGRYKKYRSINITGDMRVLYLQLDNEAVFDIIGTHSQLYG